MEPPKGLAGLEPTTTTLMCAAFPVKLKTYTYYINETFFLSSIKR